MAGATALVKFDADTSAMNAKLDRTKRKVGDIGQAFLGSATNVKGMATSLGGMIGPLAVIQQMWSNIAADVARTEKAMESQKSSHDIRAQAVVTAKGDQTVLKKMDEAVDKMRSVAGTDERQAYMIMNRAFSLFGNQAFELTDTFIQLERTQQNTYDMLTGLSAFVGASKDKSTEGIKTLVDMFVATVPYARAPAGEVVRYTAEPAIAAAARTKTPQETFAEILAIMGATTGKEFDRLRTSLMKVIGVAVEKNMLKEGGSLFKVLRDFAQMSPQRALKVFGVENYGDPELIMKGIERAEEAYKDISKPYGSLAKADAALNENIRLAIEMKRRSDEQEGLMEAEQRANQKTVLEIQANRYTRENPYSSWLIPFSTSAATYAESGEAGKNGARSGFAVLDNAVSEFLMRQTGRGRQMSEDEMRRRMWPDIGPVNVNVQIPPTYLNAQVGEQGQKGER